MGWFGKKSKVQTSGPSVTGAQTDREAAEAEAAAHFEGSAAGAAQPPADMPVQSLEDLDAEVQALMGQAEENKHHETGRSPEDDKGGNSTADQNTDAAGETVTEAAVVKKKGLFGRMFGSKKSDKNAGEKKGETEKMSENAGGRAQNENDPLNLADVRDHDATNGLAGY